MRQVLLAIGGLLLTFYTFGQRRQDEFIIWPTDTNTEKIYFSKSVYLPEQAVATVYDNAKKFAKNMFKGPKDIIIENDEAKTVTCRSAFFIPVEELGERGKGYISFTFSIWCHNNSYKYYLTDLQHFPLNVNSVAGGPLENEKAASGPVLFPRKYWNEQKAKCYYRIQTTIEQLKLAMNGETDA